MKEYRNYGIGTELMKKMLAELKACGHKQASLSVQKLNYAVKMYQKLGFQIIDENEEEYIMVCQILKQMHILVVYCHPSKNSFTHAVKESFVKGLEDAGYSYEISDLYEGNFCPVMSEDEYVREGFYQMDRPVKEDVLREQEKINRSDIIVFIYPDFWTASSAMLEGWFQRVWTYGFAYGNERAMKTLEKAMFLVTMGGSLKDEIRRKQLEAMKTVMVGDRIRDRAKKCEVYVFDEMTRGYGNDENREKRAILFSNRAYDLAKNIESTFANLSRDCNG